MKNANKPNNRHFCFNRRPKHQPHSFADDDGGDDDDEGGEKKSTISLMLESLNDWTSELDARKNVDVIYFDFEKAFDK
ncbi:hypothetical protein TELCIR_10512, partial [Teladorsagia circumcincta]